MEVHLGLVRVRRRVDPRVRAKDRVLSEMTGVKLHYGCGSRILAGWLNIDGWASPGIDFVTDLRQPLPLADRSCRLIFSEHVFEHIDRPFRVGVLRDFLRVLEPDGILRLVVPDVEQFVEAYRRRDIEWFDTVFDTVSVSGANSAEGLNNVFLTHSHRFIDDFESLSALFREAGFTRIQRSKLNESGEPKLRIDNDQQSRAICSLYIEARP